MQNHRETILVLNNQTTGFEKRGKKKGTRSKNPSSILVSASKCLVRRKQEKKRLNMNLGGEGCSLQVLYLC